MAHCHICGATNCRLYNKNGLYICDECKAKEEKIKQGIYNVKKGIFVFVFTKIVPFFTPLFVGMGLSQSVKGSVNSVALIIVFSVVATALWIGFFILGKKASNRFAQMCCRFIRRIFFAGAAGFALLACEMLGLVQQTAS